MLTTSVKKIKIYLSTYFVEWKDKKDSPVDHEVIFNIHIFLLLS
jgi:hypothetical protein